MARPIGTLDELITVTSDIDIWVCQCCAKKDHKRQRNMMNTRMANILPPPKLFISLVADPASMDVDATCTKEEFM